MPRPEGLPRASRVRKSREFERARERGRSVHTRHLVLVCAPAPGASVRLGLIASRRVGSAVARNRGKRLVRELFRRNRALFPHVDLIVVLKPGVDGATLAELLDEVRRALPPLRAAAAKLAASARPGELRERPGGPTLSPAPEGARRRRGRAR